MPSYRHDFNLTLFGLRLSRPLLKLVPVKTGIGGGLLIDYSTKKLKSQEIFEKNLRFF